MDIKLEPASKGDIEFCFQVTEKVMRGYVEQTWGTWDAQEERRKYTSRFCPEYYWIIVVGGQRAGIMEYEEHDNFIQLGTLYVLPFFQSIGVGSFVLARIVQKAAERPLRLRILAVNTRAQAFYVRHGFVVTKVDSERIYMELQAKSTGLVETTTRR